ncbi:MAG: hypothetical protein ACPL7K_00895 [Armatimonadota bacterium]
MRGRANSVASEVAANLAEVLIGGKQSIVLVFAIALFSVNANLISDGLGLFLTPGRSLVTGTLFLALFAFAVRFGLRRIASGMKLLVVQDDKPATCKVLILFLSPVGKDIQIANDIAERKLRADIHQLADRQLFNGSWRMPLEAIAYHLNRLEKVIVVPSADSPGKTDGTFRELDLFRRTVAAMCANPPEVISAHELGADGENGVDFETAAALVGVLERVYDSLRQQYPFYEVLIDITGGQKVPTVAGATVALDVGRRIQYVSLRDYSVRVYDFTVSSTR